MADNLRKYKQKRDFRETKEPKGRVLKSKGKRLRFVVQHHMARREHYDFRLELDGTLKSFAVPKGPSYNTRDKRLAVAVEDHPIEYRNFEGVIPKGQYGGGTVMIWDEGYWEPLGDAKKDFKNGAIKFKLHGKRLKGEWTLVYFKDDNWLLIKEDDGVNFYRDINELKTSIRTGRTMKEIEEGKKKIVKNKSKDNIVEGIKITNPDKVIFKSPKITKGEIVDYYKKISKRMLPYMENRLISVVRCPEGMDGDKFFKKHLDNDNEGIGSINIANDKGNRQDYYYIRDVSGIISEVQMNSFEFHIWGSKVSSYKHPDMIVFDLDPDEGMSLKRIRDGVRDLKSILDEFKLQSFLKTSGGKGYHVVVPVTSFKSWNKARNVSKNIATLMETKWPEKYVSNMRMEKRKGKIFIDWVRNTEGATSVAPYSIRVRKGARVSMPIKWSELDKVKPDSITMEEAIRRMKRKDPWEGFFK